jgi:uncharacterized protein (TIGR00290 family)
MRVFSSWSGGKDSALACYEAAMQGNAVVSLLTMVSSEFKRSGAHGIHYQLMYDQAKAMGIPMMQKDFDQDNYEEKFKEAVTDLKSDGVSGMITGDIYLQEHRDWVERVCREMGITPIIPLWDRPRESVVAEFEQEGFRAIVVSAQADLMDQSWLGREINLQFAADLGRLSPEIDVCGEAGEYHTFVVDGPLFKRPIHITESKPLLREGRWFLDIVRYHIGAENE